jgi:hypothetical protein
LSIKNKKYQCEKSHIMPLQSRIQNYQLFLINAEKYNHLSLTNQHKKY